MSAGPRIDKDIQDEIKARGLTLRSRLPGSSAAAIAEKVLRGLDDDFAGQGYVVHDKVWRLPLGIDAKGRQREIPRPLKGTAAKYLSKVFGKEARRRHPKERPWHLGACAETGIPAEALPDIAAVWTMCVRQGARFSVRHAEWVGRLRLLVENSLPTFGGDAKMIEMPDDMREAFRIDRLYEWAGIYAMAERLAELNDGVDATPTTNLDGRLLFQGEEYRALVNTDAFPAFDPRQRTRWLQLHAPLIAAAEWIESNRGEPEDWGAQVQAAAESLEALQAPLPQEERSKAVEIWNIWFGAISRKGTQFPDMSEAGRAIICDRLRQEIVEYLTDVSGVRRAAGFAPSHGLLADVGYREVPFASFFACGEDSRS